MVLLKGRYNGPNSSFLTFCEQFRQKNHSVHTEATVSSQLASYLIPAQPFICKIKFCHFMLYSSEKVDMKYIIGVGFKLYYMAYKEHNYVLNHYQSHLTQ